MTSKARMTFRFDPLPAPKPDKPAHAAEPARQTQRQLPVRPAEESLATQTNAELLPIAPDARITEPTDTVIESYPPMNGPYLDDDIRALEDMIRRTDSVVVHLPKQPRQPEARQQAEPKAPPTPISQPAPPMIDWKIPAARERQPRLVRELEQIETDHEQPERWSLPEDEAGDYRPANAGWMSRSGAYAPPSAPSWTRVILSVAAAIVTGALFGYMVLTLFTGEPIFPSKTPETDGTESVLLPSADPSPATSATSLPGTTGDTDVPRSAEPNGTIAEVPANEAYVLQYGVFKSADSAQLAVAQLQEVGLPAAIDDTDGYRVYAGIASTKAEAELLAAQMPNIEVYVKPAGGATLLLGAGELTEATASYMTKSAALGQLISQLTVSGLQDDLPQPMSADDADALKQASADWQASRTAAGALTGAAKAPADKLGQSLDSALDSLASYGGKPSRYHLWGAQTAVLQARLADGELRRTLQPSTQG
ncbi:SPOR domain-containing protein [Cohnella sp. GCM10027633]|uniref:SPOR domain-containing protein n=1 Tax=unclassified Cohnella TaxID=2636738 RepID=UPI003639931E